MKSYQKTTELFLRDFPRTLFPLNTNKILIENIPEKLGEFVYQQIKHDSESEVKFLPQRRVYADKSEHHLRRTFKLDPVAEFFLYDLVYRNRNVFRSNVKETRRSYGYRFKEGNFLSPSMSYSSFKLSIQKSQREFKYCAKFDIAAYFNSIYQHDLVSWFKGLEVNEDDGDFFDKFLRQINVGRSVDCLPQGIMPAKIIGSHFLKFIDNSNRLQSELLLRFMDDFYLFSDSYETLLSDFFQIQRMLGEKALSINSSKTDIGEINYLDLEEEIDEMKINLLLRRRDFIMVSGWDGDDDGDDDGATLSSDEIQYLFSLLSPNIDESDAELILSLMRDHSEDVLEHIPNFLNQFPNLAKNIFYFCEYVVDTESLGDIVYEFLRQSRHVTEYQLFWLGKLSEERLQKTKQYGDILIAIYNHENGTFISQSKILEIPEKRYGMGDLREEHLRTGSSDWLAWSSAIGSRAEKKGNRNHLLSYFSNGSLMNKLISECVVKL